MFCVAAAALAVGQVKRGDVWVEGLEAGENMACAEKRILERYELSGSKPSVIRMDTAGRMRALYDALLARGLPMAERRTVRRCHIVEPGDTLWLADHGKFNGCVFDGQLIEW